MWRPNRWRGRLRARCERPVLFPRRTLGHPIGYQLLFPFGNGKFGIGRRHQLAFIVRGDSPQKFTAVWITRTQDLQRLITQVEPQVGFARLAVRPVASETSIREDWPNVPIEIDLTGCRLGGRARSKANENQASSKQASSKQGGAKRHLWRENLEILRGSVSSLPARLREGRAVRAGVGSDSSLSGPERPTLPEGE